MFYHFNLAKKERHQYRGTAYEIAVYRTEEDGRLRGYISHGGFSDRIAEMSGEVAYDIKVTTGNDAVESLVDAMKLEIEAGKFPVTRRT